MIFVAFCDGLGGLRSRFPSYFMRFWALDVNIHRILQWFWALEVDFHHILRGFNQGGPLQTLQSVVHGYEPYSIVFYEGLIKGDRYKPYSQLSTVMSRIPSYFTRV